MPTSSRSLSSRSLSLLQRTCRRSLFQSLLLFTALSCYEQPVFSQSVELTDEEKQQQVAADRFLTVLQKSPRRGTALDRVYSHHVEFGTLDKLIASLKDQSAKDPQVGNTWMLLGLFESQRGNDALAIESFQKAETLRKEDAIAPYYLGLALLRVGQSDEAIAAYERAIQRNPPRADLLEIYQQLGRVLQRSQRTAEAIQVWTRLESQFPDDARVLEQIASTLADEGATLQAIPYYEKLAKITKDDYRRVVFGVEAAQLKIKADKRDQGLAEFEVMLGELKPDSWLYRDVRRRIEDVFLKSGDQDNLVKYYEKWLATHPEDVEGMARLARFLTNSARAPEATIWMDKALKLAPSRADLRRAFIDQLVDAQKFSEVVAQYEKLAESKPGNPDILRDWGKLILRDKTVDIAVRNQRATEVWNQIVVARPNDALTLSQTADLFRQSNMPETATALYKRAIELAPNDPQYREYLGEYQHIQKLPDQALETWAAIAVGARRNAINVARLAEVYNSFGYQERAVTEILDACKLDPKDFALQIKASDYLARVARYDEAFTFMEGASKLAVSADEKDEVIKQRIQLLQSSDRLDDAIVALSEETAGSAATNLAKWLLLARYLETARRLPDANDAIAAALKLDEKSTEALSIAARIAESSGEFGKAVEMNRRLSEVDRRSRGDYLQNVARLEAQLGRADQAIAAAQELIVSAPGNTDNYEFFAQLCFRLGRTDEGLEALRKAMRINPNEPRLIVALGNALSEQLRTDEAIALYWRAFERSESIEDKISLTEKLVPLYTQLNQFDKLTERFERDRQDDQKRREATVCLAQAYRSSGDTTGARSELESLISDSTRDTNLFQQLSKLCEEAGDLDAAIGYQRQLVSIAPGAETETPLAKLLQQRGELDEANEILVKLTQQEEDPVRLLKNIDSLLLQEQYDSVLAVLEPILNQQRDNWELLYREAVAWLKKERYEEAKNRFERLLAMKHDHTARGVVAEAAFKQQQSKARSDNLRGIRTTQPTVTSPLTFGSRSYEIRRAVGLEQYYDPFNQSASQTAWSPDVFGMARLATIGWLLSIDQRVDTEQNIESNKNPLLVTIEKASLDPKATRDQIYDALYLSQLENRLDRTFAVAKSLAKSGGRDEKMFFLSSLTTRNQSDQNRPSNQGPSNPLSQEELELMLSCYRDVLKSKEVGGDSSNVVFDSNGTMYVLVGGRYVQAGSSIGNQFSQIVSKELKLAGRNEESEAMLAEQFASAKTPQEIGSLIIYQITNNKLQEVDENYNRLLSALDEAVSKLNLDAKPSGPSAANRSNPLPVAMGTIGTWIGYLGADEENAKIIEVTNQLLDRLVKVTRMEVIASTKKPQRTSATTPSATRFSWNYGKQNQTTTLDYPAPNTYLKSPSLMYLRRVFEVLKRNNSQSDLVDLLKKRVAEAEEANKLYESLMLAAVQWWNDDKEESQDLTIAVAKLIPQDLEFQFGIAAMLEARKDLDEAMATLESIQGVDQSIIVRKERTILSLAERLGDRDRAKKAAERLFGLRIDTATQMSLVDSMRRLGLTELSDAILARAEKRVGNQAASMATLMMQMQGQGKPAQAKQLAYSILNKTKPVIITGSRSRSVSSSGNTDVAARQQALQLLFQSGELKELVGKLDAQLEKSPTSMVLYDRLIEANTMMGNKDKSLDLMQRAAEKNPQSPMMRLRLASTLASSGKAKEACDQYLELIKTDLRVLSNDFYEIQNTFRQANRQKELTAAISRQNLKSISQPYYIINLVSETLRTNPKDEGALELVERTFTAFPQYQSQLVSQLNGSKVWDNEKMFSLIKRSFAPPASIIQQNAWAGVGTNSYSYSSNGQINDPMMEITAAIGDTKRRELRSIVDKHLEENPGWLGGKALKLMFDIQLKDMEAIRSGVHELIDHESIKKSMPATVAWMLGGSIANFQELLEESTQLMLKASEERSGMNDFQYTPGYILSKNYQKMGRKEDARKLLLSGLQSGDQFDSYSVSRAKMSSKSIADELANIGFHLDAIRVYTQLLADKEYLSQSDPFTGRSAKDTEASIKTGLQKSITAMKPEDAASAIDQLLSVGKKVSSNSDLSLGITFQSIAATSATPIESQLLQILGRIGKNAEVIKLMQSRLELLAKENKKSIAIPIAQVALARTASGDAVGAAPPVTLEALDTFVKEQPLEPIPAGRKANARQRKEAIDYVGIWLAVKEDLAASTNNETAERLANVALEAANRQADKLATSAILWQWGEVHKSRGEIEKAEAKWSELLTMITERPVRKASEPNAAIPAMPGGVPFPGAPIPGTVPARALPAPAGAAPAGLVPAGVAPAPALRPAQPTPIVKFVAFQESSSKPQETKNSTDSTKADDNKKVDNKKSVLPPRPNATGKGPVVPSPGAPSSRGAVPGGALPPGFGPPGQVPGGVPRPSSYSNAIPPLTVSQYEVAIKIAAKAHEAGLSKLSMRALQEALKGGAPVPDPVAAANPNNPAAMSTAFITSGGITRAVAVGSPQATANATNFSKATTVVRDWLSKAESYPPKDVYDCLSSIVFPTDRENDLVMGEVSTGLAQGSVTSLGSQLVQWAKRSDQLDQLEKKLEERKTTPNLTPHRQVLLGLCALEKEDAVKAKKVLEELVAYVEKNPSPDNTALASHFALPASTRQPLQELSLSILKLASSNLSNVAASSGGNARTSSSGNSLTNLVNKYYVDRGNEELIRKYFEDRLAATQVQYSNYGGDYGLQMQKQELASIATQSAMFGSAKITLEYLGRFVDFGSVRDRASTSLAVPLCAVIRSLRNTQPEEAYRTWLEWTMPNDNRKTIRVLSALMRPDSMPDEFRQQSNRNSVRMDDDVVLNLRELVSLAVKTGKLEELVIASDKARADKVPGSIELAMMIAVEKRDSDTFDRVGKELVDQSKQKNVNSEGMYYSNNAANISSDVSICRLAIREGVLKIGDELRDALVSDSTAFHLEDIHRLASQLKAERRPNVSPDFPHWTASNTSVNGIKGWWESVDQQIVHLTGAANDTLFLNYPITGNFVFNATVSSTVGLEFGFDGIGIRQQANQLLVTSRSGVSILNKPITNVREEMAQIRIESKDGRVQFFINDESVYERQAEGSSPWVFIAAQNNTIAFSNLSLSGTPTVSESVALVLGKRLDGWIANFYAESVFNPIVKTDNNDQVPQGYTQDPNTGELVPIDNRSVKQWTNSDGVLSIAATEKGLEAAPSWLYYQRPLRQEESVSYEFFYKPNESIVYPSIGRVAFQLSEDNVKTHWIESTIGSFEAIALDNAREEKLNRRGSDQLPLKTNDWNRMDVALMDNRIQLKLNGELIFERRMDSAASSVFGFFRYKHQSVNVRNIVLSGKWASEWNDSIGSKLAMANNKRNQADNRVIEFVTQDRFAALEVQRIVEQAKGMSNEDAFAFLKSWVFPDENHASIRLYHQWTNDRFDCPAIELIRLSQELGRLEELRRETESVKVIDAVNEQGKFGFLALLAIQSKDLANAKDAMAKVYAKIDEVVKQTKSIHQRSPAIVVSHFASFDPALFNFASDIALKLRTVDRSEKRRVTSWQDQIARLTNHLEKTGFSERERATISQWHAMIAPYAAKTDGAKLQPTWLFKPGFARHLPGAENQMLVFQSPLKGNFTVTANVSTYNSREMLVGYQFDAVTPRGKNEFAKYILPYSNQQVKRDFADLRSGSFSELRLEVSDSLAKTYFNNVLIEETNGQRDWLPWLTISAQNAPFDAQLRNLTISGKPTIPTEVSLLPTADTIGWNTPFGEQLMVADDESNYEYYRSMGLWGFKSSTNEIVYESAKKTKEPVESLLRYLRPLLEDGELEFESYYVPNDTEAHPSIGNLAWILRENGVTLHRIGTDRSPKNAASTSQDTLEGATVTETATKVPLVPNRWNAIKLRCMGDEVTLIVNEQEVGKGKLENKPSSRYFGLFHFSNATNSKVRNIKYRGKWPTTIPAVEDQYLAGDYRRATANEDLTSVVVEQSFASADLGKLNASGWRRVGAEESLKPTDKGLRASLTKAKDSSRWPGVEYAKKLAGDGAIEIAFSDLALKQGKEGWGVNSGVFLKLDEPEESEIEIVLIQYAGGGMSVQSVLRRKNPLGENATVQRVAYEVGKIVDGRLRIERVGKRFDLMLGKSAAGDFELVDQFTTSNSPIRSISLQSRGSDDEGEINIVWGNAKIAGFSTIP